MKQSFFIHINEKLFIKKKKCINFKHYSENYTCELLRKLEAADPYGTMGCKFYCEDGIVVSVPWYLIKLSWPNLFKIIGAQFGPLQEPCDIGISLPCDHTMLIMFKKLISPESFSDNYSSFEKRCILEFIKKFNIDPIVQIYDKETYCSYSSSTLREDYQVLEQEKQSSNYSKEIVQDPDIGSCSCKNKCSSIVRKKWNRDDIEKLKSMFQGDVKREVKTNLLKHLSSQDNIGISTEAYVIKEHAFCIQFLSKVTLISHYILKSVLEDYNKGIRLYQNAKKGVIKSPTSATSGFIAWFTNFVNIYAQDAPDEQLKILPYWLKTSVLFDIYIQEAPQPHVKLPTFYQHLQKYFGPDRCYKTYPRVRRSKYSSHSVCSDCDTYNVNQKMSTSESDLKRIKDLRNLHLLEVGQTRNKIMEIKQLAITFPADHVFIQIDGDILSLVFCYN